MSDLQISGPAGALPFIYGHVDPTFFPVERLREAANEALARYSQSALNYGAALGADPLRAFLREKLVRDENLEIGPENLMITASASDALSTAVRVFTQPGDTVLVEAPSYHEALANIRDYPIQLAAVPIDEEGLLADSLLEKLKALLSAGERPALLYTIPCFQNPSGVTMSRERRLQVLSLAQRYGVRIVEDDVYRDLYFECPPPPSLYALDSKGLVIRLGSFSKVMAPGLRVGWAIGPAEGIRRMSNCGLALSGGGANPFTAHILAVFCQHGWLEPHVARLRANYRERRNILLAALRRFMPAGVTWTRPAGGFFVWLSLPEPMTARSLLARVEEQGVTFLTGEPFFVEAGGERNIRLPFSYVERTDLERGVEIMGRAALSSAFDPTVRGDPTT